MAGHNFTGCSESRFTTFGFLFIDENYGIRNMGQREKDIGEVLGRCHGNQI